MGKHMEPDWRNGKRWVILALSGIVYIAIAGGCSRLLSALALAPPEPLYSLMAGAVLLPVAAPFLVMLFWGCRRRLACCQEGESRLCAIVEDLPILICRNRPDGTIVFVNNAYCEYFGRTRENLLGCDLFELIPEKDRERVRENLCRLSAETPVLVHEHEVYAADGSIRYHRWTNRPICDETGNVVLIQAVGEDISERKQAETALRQSEEQYRLMFENAGVLVSAYDLRGRCVLMNELVARAFGGVPEEFIGRSFNELHPGHGEEFTRRIREAIETGEVRAYEDEVAFPSGERWLISSVFPMRNADGVASAAQIVSQDITEQKRAEKALEAQNAELERFTYTVSHDLKSPLITIDGYVGMLAEDLAEGDSNAVEEDIGRISSATRKMNRLLGELLELSRIGRIVNPPTEISLRELVEETLQIVHRQIEERQVQVDIVPDLPDVYGDCIRLQEVFQNLIENAAKYMGNQVAPRVEIGGRREGNEVLCFVRDNGIGIDPKYHERIFGLFDQLDPNATGSGVGLALARRIVDVHGGRIWVESQGDGRGSTFFFTLPTSNDSSVKTHP